MTCPKTVAFCRQHCRKVYLVGEHLTASLYAVCEFTDLHILLIAASLILLVGVVMVAIDSLLDSLGI